MNYEQATLTKVVPARAGVILCFISYRMMMIGRSRASGGDPVPIRLFSCL